MKIAKLDKQQKLFDLYKLLGSMYRIDTVNGDIILDDELKATVFAAIEPILKRRISKGEVLPVFEGSDAMQIDAFPEEDAYAIGVGEDPLDLGKSEQLVDHIVSSQNTVQNGQSVPDMDAVSIGSNAAPVKAAKRNKYVAGFEKP